jgi:hypothetical protein
MQDEDGDLYGADIPYDGDIEAIEREVAELMRAAAPLVAEETAKERAEWYAAHLADEIDKDRGYVGRDDTLDELAQIWTHDKAGWLRLEPILRAAKVLAITKPEVKRRAAAQRSLLVLAGPDRRLVIDAIETAPVPPETAVPKDWEIRRHSSHGSPCLLKRIVRRRGDTATVDLVGVATDHMLVTAILTDVDTEETHLEVAYCKGKHWVHKVVPRSVLASPRALAESVAGYGFPVDGSNAPEILQWLVAFESLNIAVLPRRRVTRQMGWQPVKTKVGGAPGFVVGSTHLRDDDESEIHFHGSDTGDKHLVRCLQPAGTYDKWAEGAAIGAAHPIAGVAIYASLAPPILKILRAPNFVVEWSGKTATGKTTALSLGASVWGNPDPNHRDSFIASWATTKVGIERRAANLSHLPLVTDDTKRAAVWRGVSVVPGTIFDIANGQGKGRGSVKGTREILYWRTVMLSSGEQRAVDYDKSGGVASRVVSLWGSAFAVASETQIAAMNRAIFENYGHAGRLWVEWLRENKDKWSGWRDRHLVLRADLKQALLASDQAPADRSVADRIAGSLAVIDLVGEIAHDALDLPWERGRPVVGLIGLIASGARVADRETEALGVVASHLSSHYHELERTTDQAKPTRGWLGVIAAGPWAEVSVYPKKLKDLLRDQGFEPSSILRRWREDGVILCDKGHLTTRRTAASGARPSVIVFRRKPIEEAGFCPSDELPPEPKIPPAADPDDPGPGSGDEPPPRATPLPDPDDGSF